jgi:hypothetical protein
MEAKRGTRTAAAEISLLEQHKTLHREIRDETILKEQETTNVGQYFESQHVDRMR